MRWRWVFNHLPYHFCSVTGQTELPLEFKLLQGQGLLVVDHCNPMDIDAQHLVGAQLIFVDRVTDSQLVSWNLVSCIVLLSFFFLKLIYFLIEG